jgi:hypothetical protein
VPDPPEDPTVLRPRFLDLRDDLADLLLAASGVDRAILVR